MTQPEREARDLLARHSASLAPVAVEDIAVAEDIRVVFQAGTGGEFGFLMRPGNGLYEVSRTMIGVNSRRSVRRQRLAIAHQLGHFTLHSVRLDTMCFDVRNGQQSNEPSMLEEAEATAFASALLMPGELVDAAVRRGLAAAASREVLVRRLAAEFDVSNEVVTWRLLGLGVLT